MIINNEIDRILGYMSYLFYTRIYCPVKAFFMRRKSHINVIFIITELGVWKTEELYLKMKSHPRFNPVLRVLPSMENAAAKDEVIAYLNKKNYDYEYISENEPIQKSFKADIIFYQKPYLWVYAPRHAFTKNKRSLLCYSAYGFHNVISNYICNQPYHNYAWQYYFENQICSEQTAVAMDNQGFNIKITGVPMSDAFLLPSESYHANWKPQSRKKKKIIWAPHFSVSAGDVLSYSTFLNYSQFMLDMASKYRREVQFLFKPHPLLFQRLCLLWGEHKAKSYYDVWDKMENTQVELGQYIDFFMTSDAMIHDCSSFTIEYLYTHKPVMYLSKGVNDQHDSNLNSFAKEAFHLHYMGTSESDIENFIIRVLNNDDELFQDREVFFAENLLPPHGQSACKNIMNSILGH